MSRFERRQSIDAVLGAPDRRLHIFFISVVLFSRSRGHRPPLGRRRRRPNGCRSPRRLLQLPRQRRINTRLPKIIRLHDRQHFSIDALGLHRRAERVRRAPVADELAHQVPDGRRLGRPLRLLDELRVLGDGPLVGEVYSKISARFPLTEGGGDFLL